MSAAVMRSNPRANTAALSEKATPMPWARSRPDPDVTGNARRAPNGRGL